MIFLLLLIGVIHNDPGIAPYPLEPAKVPASYAVFTAYVKNCKGCSGTMANGKEAIGSWVAADPSWKFGACLEYLYQKKWHRVRVGDRGGDIHGKHRFDILVASKREAIQFGKRKLQYRRCK